MEETFQLTKTEIAKAFDRWKEKRIRNPLLFEHPVNCLEEKDYGENCATFLLELLNNG